MRRRKRLSAAALLIALSIAGWVRSHFHADTLFHGSPSHRVGVGLLPGTIVFFAIDAHPGTNFPPQTGLMFKGPPLDPQKRRPSLDTGPWGLRCGSEQTEVSRSSSPLTTDLNPVGTGNDIPSNARRIAIPFFLIILLASGLPAIPCRSPRGAELRL